ncbi:NTE family protein [Blastococcus colisei]|uniref:NTE family protein n=1 Tax=Blastococcus colisei TaxID=1564162 RepID=A0A543PJ25_9ACTN|nr:patatin-like phospholipase family protein [Blastococcus colisei]TQN44073.1 NTE family protein [Blastococcus colisei]
MTTDRVGLALSGGGFRATAFGLGCLRALHDTGVLSKVTVVSGISGGSLLAALWAYGPSSFQEFDGQVVELLERGLQLELSTRTLSPVRVARRGVDLIAAARPDGRGRPSRNRTDVLAALLADRAFGDKYLPDVTYAGLSTVLSATDLITSRAVRFGSDLSSLSTYGRIVEPIRVAEAVAASAAFPLAFPAVQRTYTFERGGQTQQQRLALTDGGVYDNLGLPVLEPGRDPRFSDHVYPLDYIVACDAGRQERGASRARVLPFRLMRSFDITYRKTQDGTRARLHAARSTGQIRGFVHAYLGMRDRRLPMPAPGLVPMEQVNQYGTNFKKMSRGNLDAITSRGEQLTRLLLQHYCPALLG